MSGEREETIQKDLLWDYMKAKKTLETYRVDFRRMAEFHADLATRLRDNPESIATAVDIGHMRSEADSLASKVEEFRQLLATNAEREGSLIKMHVISSDD